MTTKKIMQKWKKFTPDRATTYDKKNEGVAAQIISAHLPLNITLELHHDSRAKSQDLNAYYHMNDHGPILIAYLEIEQSGKIWAADQVWPDKWRNVTVPQRKVREFDQSQKVFSTRPVSDKLDKTLFIKFNQNHTSAYAVRLDHVHMNYGIVRDVKGLADYNAGIMFVPKEDCRYHTIGLPDTMAYTRSFLELRANLAHCFHAGSAKGIPFPLSYTASDVALMEAVQFAEKLVLT